MFLPINVQLLKVNGLQRKQLIYTVKANRFLRGMVRGLVGTMLLVGRKKITITGV